MKIDLERLADYRRGACLPACGCAATTRSGASRLVVVTIERQEWQRARTRHRLRCGQCGRWGRKFVPERFLEETN